MRIKILISLTWYIPVAILEFQYDQEPTGINFINNPPFQVIEAWQEAALEWITYLIEINTSVPVRKNILQYTKKETWNNLYF